MKTQTVLVWLTMPVSFLRACDIKRACAPTWKSPMLPCISELGTNAATLSKTIMSRALERTRCSIISRACSAESGWEMRSESMSTPMALA